MSLFATGAIWASTTPDGAMAASAVPLNQEQNQFEVVDSRRTPASILYAGCAAGMINGVFQVNVQLPPGAVPPLTLTDGPAPATRSRSSCNEPNRARDLGLTGAAGPDRAL